MQESSLVPIGNQTLIPGTFDGYPKELAEQVQRLQGIQAQLAKIRTHERAIKADVLRLMHEYEVEEIVLNRETGQTLSRDLVETVKFRKKRVQRTETE